MRRLKDVSGLRQIERDMKHFCIEIGTRLAGSPAEKRAADYTAERFRELGMTDVACLPFACKRWLPGRSELITLAPFEKTIPCATITHSAATPEEGVAGDLVILEPQDYERGLRAANLEGKIGLFYGLYTESASVFEQLQNSPLKALLFVDTRLTADWPIAEGMGEKYMPLVRKPMANVSLRDAWAIAHQGVKRVRLISTGEVADATSYNAVGEIRGPDPTGKVIVVSGHIDSVAVGVGADDNASGMAAVLECARRLREHTGPHTLRFIGFGAEEQLSVGSYRYVKDQAGDLDRIGFACNFDGIAALLGISEIFCMGTPALDDYVWRVVEERQGFGRVTPSVSPYQDQFPFAARSIPGVWFTRKTHRDMYWYHHSVKNDLDVCSMEQIAWTAETACEMLRDLASKDEWTFPRELAPEVMKEVDRYARNMFP